MLMERYARASFQDQDDFMQNYNITVPENYNFAFDCVDELACLSPDKPALVWCNDKGEEATYTFSQLSALSDAAARFFAAAGIRPGDAVMLMLKRRAQFWFALLGLMKLGAVAIPATHLLTEKDIIYRNNAASTVAIITTGDEPLLAAVDASIPHSPTVRCRIKLGGARAGWLRFDEGLAAHQAGPAPLRVTHNNDLMMLYFTSGTTGMPKMVAHNFAYPLAHITTARFWQQLHPGSLHLTVADTGWAKAAWGKIFGQWLCEAAVFVYDHERFSACDMLNVISRHRVTSFCAPPTVYRFLIKEDLSAYDLHALEHVTTAGEPLNAEVFTQFKKQTGLSIYEAYGQTEMAPMVITTPYMQPRPGALGIASPAYEMLLLDDAGNEVAPGQEGEICIRTAPGEKLGVFQGYYRDAPLTAGAFRSEVYHTGDKAQRDTDGYLWFIGRADDVIKASGYRIGPFEVESVLMEHPAVLECAVTGTPDPIRGQAVKASIILAKGYTASEELKKELQAFVKTNTAPYKYPRVVEFVSELPKTISGKIQRVLIREGAQDTAALPKKDTAKQPGKPSLTSKRKLAAKG